MTDELNMAILSGNDIKAYIESKLGLGKTIHVVALTEFNMLGMRTSKPFVFTQNLLPEEKDKGLHDGDHILLFPQDDEGLCPRAWVEASWSYLEKFRSNFSFFPLEAEMYYNVTLVGAATGDRFGISIEVEQALAKDKWRKVTRIECANAKELSEALDRRIQAGRAFLEE